MTEMPREFYRKKFPFGEGMLDELERTKEFSFGTGLGFGEIDYILSRNRDLQGDIDKLRMRALRLQQDPREEIENKIYSKN